MGVVWKATDTTLGRTVAVKVLPEAFAGDPERMARFEREARLLATLNHPHIATIYGVGSAAGVRFLAMELVEGDDLAVRLAQGALPVAETVELASQLAQALEAAHEKGIIHRDLKPANVKLTADGQVKVLDFGLAKALEGDPVVASSSAVLNSPTLTSPMTAANVILGTAAYMSPEQARGKTVDRRADIWAFGCVLYECLTGRRPFPGETVSDTIAKILEREPDWTALPAGVGPRLRELLRRCLEKDARKRLRDIGDARIELDELLATGVSGSGTTSVPGQLPTATPQPGGSAGLAWGVAALAVVLAAAAILFPGLFRRSQHPVAARSTITSPAGMNISSIPADAALSPDGTMLVFAASDSGGRSRLWLRPLASLEARPIEGTEFVGAESPGLPFWSPDGKSIGFFADDKLKTIPVTGGDPTVLSSVSNARGGTWSRDGVILFAPSSQGPLYRIRQSGGEATPVTALDTTRHETAHRFPRFLPDGRHYEFVSLPGMEGRLDTWVGELGSHTRTLVVTAASSAVYAPPGHMAFVRDQSLVIQPFDLGRLQLTGEPAQIGDAPEDLTTLGTNPASASESGVLVYPTSAPASCRLAWFGRDGKEQGELAVAPGDYREIAISPDSREVALVRRSSATSSDIWIADAARGGLTRLTTDGSLKNTPRWSGDGSRLAYGVVRGSQSDFVERSVSGSADEHSLFGSRSMFKQMSQITRDGQFMVFDDLERTTQRDLWVAPLQGDRKPFVYLSTPFSEAGGSISPDGHWMLYLSNESGRDEMYVQSFPVPGHKLRISTDGAFGGGWRDDGAEILYASQKGAMTVPVQTGAALTAGEPHLLFVPPKETVSLDVTPHFDRFLIALASGDARRASLTVLTNWSSLLAR